MYIHRYVPILTPALLPSKLSVKKACSDQSTHTMNTQEHESLNLSMSAETIPVTGPPSELFRRKQGPVLKSRLTARALSCQKLLENVTP